jgi:hypothetical protein
MAGFDPATHVLIGTGGIKDVDARIKSGQGER